MSLKATVRHTRIADVRPLIELQKRVYPTIPPWREDLMLHQLEIFPQGQMVAEFNGRVFNATTNGGLGSLNRYALRS